MLSAPPSAVVERLSTISMSARWPSDLVLDMAVSPRTTLFAFTGPYGVAGVTAEDGVIASVAADASTPPPEASRVVAVAGPRTTRPSA